MNSIIPINNKIKKNALNLILLRLLIKETSEDINVMIISRSKGEFIRGVCNLKPAGIRKSNGNKEYRPMIGLDIVKITRKMLGTNNDAGTPPITTIKATAIVHGITTVNTRSWLIVFSPKKFIWNHILAIGLQFSLAWLIFWYSHTKRWTDT